MSEVERLRDHWLHNYDWRVHEAKINELPQFTLPIDVDEFGEMTIHFVHQKSNIEGAIPLIFIHGWPGSFYEVHKILPLLTQPTNGEQAFHVVAPRYFPPRECADSEVCQDIVGVQIPIKRVSIFEKWQRYSINSCLPWDTQNT